VLSSKAEKKPLLQGWAIVDNTIGEDWNDVELSLVAGAPHSSSAAFAAVLRKAARRTAARERATDPQTHAATLEPLARQMAGGVPGGSRVDRWVA